MKVGKKDEELVKVTYRFPKELCEKIEESAIESRRSINDDLITILEIVFGSPELMLEIRRQAAIASVKATINDLTILQKGIEEYATKWSISVEQATADLGIADLVKKGIAKIEAQGGSRKTG